jgi:hypothetical protein
MKSTYTKVHMSELQDKFPFDFKKGQFPRMWGIHIKIWDGNTQANPPLGWIDDENFLFYATEQERDEAYDFWTGE